MATYPYESLNPDSFQQLIQSILSKTYPDFQCFPVGHADGGRDGVVRLEDDSSPAKPFILFQVKFTRERLTNRQARSWLLKTIENELPSIRDQISRGAERFVLISNVPGTGPQETGSIDRLHSLLNESLPIPAVAWWRDDVDRRLDSEWDLKFAYPSLLTGPDVVRYLVESHPQEDRQRRHNAIKAFISGQYKSDSEVKFKQAELKNDLFRLFTDIPIVPSAPTTHGEPQMAQLTSAIRRAATPAARELTSFWLQEWLQLGRMRRRSYRSHDPLGDFMVNAAALLLDIDFQRAEPLVILQGGPGQGKSTIVQYICQIHRHRLLELPPKDEIDDQILDSPLRLPFKVDLRDFASWIAGGNPFGDFPVQSSEDQFQRSLDGFLAALVRYESGGAQFTVSDLHATLQSSPTIIVLDGLDEVADSSRRQEVVDSISSALPRLQALSASLQLILTTRPNPFATSTVLPHTGFATYSLDNLTRTSIGAYAERWLQSQDIDDREAREVRAILTEKLNEPHLQALARNPMQLSILLNLIHRRGVSLPDKRTALYDSYMDLFFDRESEKASAVRENRDLLIRIHRYLAWVLHSEAELASKSRSRSLGTGTRRTGTITQASLMTLIRDFLQADGSDVELADTLFGGLVERVVAIVSRIEGLYEFDVQTLREYFAARHLYETAPYSPAGEIRRGTRSDRWRALCRNPYWFNVARFYAGCYSEGELASLLDELDALREDVAFRNTHQPQLLTATLLGDYVFSQRRRTMNSAVALLCEERSVRIFAARDEFALRQVDDIIVRDKGGREQLFEACKALIVPGRPTEEMVDLGRSILRRNCDPEELHRWWLEMLKSADEGDVPWWCEVGDVLEGWSGVSAEAVMQLLNTEQIPSEKVIAGLLHADRVDLFHGQEGLFEAGVSAILDGEWLAPHGPESILHALAMTLHPRFLSEVRSRHSFGMYAMDGDALDGMASLSSDEVWTAYSGAQGAADIVQAFLSEVRTGGDLWDMSTEPWDRVVETGRRSFGERSKFLELACLGAGIRSKDQQCSEYNDLFDHSRSLVKRARYARLRAGSREWWGRQFDEAREVADLQLALLLFLSYAGAKTVGDLIGRVDAMVDAMPERDWQRLHSMLETTASLNAGREWLKLLRIRGHRMPNKLGERAVVLLALRCSANNRKELYRRYLEDKETVDHVVASFRGAMEVTLALTDRARWPIAIEVLRKNYGLGVSANRELYALWGQRSRLPDGIARGVMEQASEFPSGLLRVSEARCRQLDAGTIVPVGRIAAEEGWFDS